MEGISPPYIFLSAKPQTGNVGQENMTQWLGGTISGVFHYTVLTDMAAS